MVLIKHHSFKAFPVLEVSNSPFNYVILYGNSFSSLTLAKLEFVVANGLSSLYTLEPVTSN